MFGRDLLGYDVRSGKLYVNENGAETVRLIYQKFVEEGKGACAIARELQAAGIETARHRTEWTPTVILRILRNEKYCGDLVQRKTYTPDYLSHDKKYNHGEEEFVVLRDHHEPIISREWFERAQRELTSRSPAPKQRKTRGSRYCLSGKILCGCCGARFVSRTRKRKDGSPYLSWRCYGAVRHGSPHTDGTGRTAGCAVSRQIRDEDFLRMIQRTIRNLRIDKKGLTDDLTGMVKEVLLAGEACGTDGGTLERRLVLTAEKMDRLVDLYLNQEVSGEEYRRMAEKYAEEKKGLEEKIQNLRRRQIPSDGKEDAVSRATATIRGLISGEERDDTFYRSLVEKIVVHSRQDIEVYLKLLTRPWVYVSAQPGKAGNKQGPETEHFGNDVPILWDKMLLIFSSFPSKCTSSS